MTGTTFHDAAPRSVVELLARAAAEHPHTEVLVVAEERRTYAELADQATAMAAGLLAAGVRPGDRVCLFAPNVVEAYVSLFATAKAGAVFVPVNPRLTERELRVVLETARPTALLFAAQYNGVDYVDRLRGIYPSLAGIDEVDAGGPGQTLIVLRGVAPGATALEDLMALGRSPQHLAHQAAVEADVQPDDAALLQFTSGTTSAPKAAVLNHGPTARMSFELGERFGLTPVDRYFGCPPICHLGGTTFSLLSVVGHHATFVTLPVFEAGRSLATMVRERCTVDHGIDSHLRLQLAHPDFDPDRLALRLVSVSGVEQTVRDVAAAFGDVVVISQYGSTETGGAPVCAAWDDPVETRLSTVGRALPGVQLDVVDPDTGDRMPVGETGEIRLGGWSLMAGYLAQPEETERLFDADGRIVTGDLGVLDDGGHLRFVGRLKNMLRSGGENVSLEEVESVIAEFPDAVLAVVVPVPDERLGEVGYAFVGCERPDEFDVDALRAHCVRQLAKFKVPRFFRPIAAAAVPMNGNGKIDRRALVERAGTAHATDRR